MAPALSGERLRNCSAVIRQSFITAPSTIALTRIIPTTITGIPIKDWLGFNHLEGRFGGLS